MDFYSPSQRAWQQHFDSVRLADRVQQAVVTDAVDDSHGAFIASRDFFFLATVDSTGMPTVSYKGGAPGLVRVVDPGTLAFPHYDGNGMFLSWGNALVNPQVGLLFIDFVAKRPTRLRVEGTASVRPDDDLLADWPEAQFVVRVQASRVFPNCPRYIHRMALVERSSYVPRAGIVTPVPEWKRGELAAGVLPRGDRAANRDKLDTPTREAGDARRGG